MKKFLSYLGYRSFCILFFSFCLACWYLFFRWFMLGPDSLMLWPASIIGSLAIYFSFSMYTRRGWFDNFKTNPQISWRVYHAFFRIVIFFGVWAILCLLFEIADRTIFRFLFNDYLTQVWGYKFLVLIALIIEYKYRKDRKEIIRGFYNKRIAKKSK